MKKVNAVALNMLKTIIDNMVASHYDMNGLFRRW
jgi:hypothetical protein